MTKLIVGVLLAPLYETLVAQWVIMKLVHGPLRQRWWIASMVSSVVFAVAHGHSDRWFFNMLAGGAVFATVFAVEARRRGRPVFTTFATHAVHNGSVMVAAALWP
jgi:membrane protease YdiL (CAAX protease family)